MDKNIFNSDKSEFLDFVRIKSKRSRLRRAHEDKDKHLIGLNRELEKLRLAKRAMPMIALNPPIRRGWKRYFILREDVRNSKDAVFYENLLRKINTEQFSSNKDFKKKVKRKGKKEWVQKEQLLKVILLQDLPKFKLSDKELECFTLVSKTEVINKKVYLKYFYVFKQDWRFVLRIRPNFIDKMKAVDEEIDLRLSELRNEIFGNYENYSRIWKIKGFRKYRDNDENIKFKNPFTNIQKHLILETFS